MALRQGAVLKSQRPSAGRLGGWEVGCERDQNYAGRGRTLWPGRNCFPLQPHIQLGLSHSLSTHETACRSGDLGLIPGLGRSPGRGHGNPLQYSCLENPHGQRSLVVYCPWGSKESDTTEQLSTAQAVHVCARSHLHSVRVQVYL